MYSCGVTVPQAEVLAETGSASASTSFMHVAANDKAIFMIISFPHVVPRQYLRIGIRSETFKQT